METISLFIPPPGGGGKMRRFDVFCKLSAVRALKASDLAEGSHQQTLWMGCRGVGREDTPPPTMGYNKRKSGHMSLKGSPRKSLKKSKVGLSLVQHTGSLSSGTAFSKKGAVRVCMTGYPPNRASPCAPLTDRADCCKNC